MSRMRFESQKDCHLPQHSPKLTVQAGHEPVTDRKIGFPGDAYHVGTCRLAESLCIRLFSSQPASMKGHNTNLKGKSIPFPTFFGRTKEEWGNYHSTDYRMSVSELTRSILDYRIINRSTPLNNQQLSAVITDKILNPMRLRAR